MPYPKMQKPATSAGSFNLAEREGFESSIFASVPLQAAFYGSHRGANTPDLFPIHSPLLVDMSKE